MDRYHRDIKKVEVKERVDIYVDSASLAENKLIEKH